MIKCDMGHLALKGEGITLLAEFSAIAHGLLETMEETGVSKEAAVKELERAVAFASKTDEERTAGSDAVKKELKGALKKLLSEVLGDD